MSVSATRQQPFRCFRNHQVPNIQIDLIVLQLFIIKPCNNIGNTQ